MTTDYDTIARLREAVESKVGRKIRTPKDFDLLRSCIFEECHVMVSVSTLKRIWGYIQTDGKPRFSSLTSLAQYIGYADWDAFVASNQQTDNQKSSPSDIDNQESKTILPIMVIRHTTTKSTRMYLNSLAVKENGSVSPPPPSRWHQVQALTWRLPLQMSKTGHPIMPTWLIYRSPATL